MERIEKHSNFNKVEAGDIIFFRRQNSKFQKFVKIVQRAFWVGNDAAVTHVALVTKRVHAKELKLSEIGDSKGLIDNTLTYKELKDENYSIFVVKPGYTHEKNSTVPKEMLKLIHSWKKQLPRTYPVHKCALSLFNNGHGNHDGIRVAVQSFVDAIKGLSPLHINGSRRSMTCVQYAAHLYQAARLIHTVNLDRLEQVTSTKRHEQVTELTKKFDHFFDSKLKEDPLFHIQAKRQTPAGLFDRIQKTGHHRILEIR